MNRAKVKASALLFVLVMLIIVILLANVVLQIMLNQSRLSWHRIWRVQALYAAQAARVLTMERLRNGNWQSYCINCGAGVNVRDDDIPYVVDIVIHNIGDSPAVNPAAPTFRGSAPIEITVNYQRAGTF